MDTETQILLNELFLMNINLLRFDYSNNHRSYRMEYVLGELLKKLYPGRSPQTPRSEQFRYDYRDFLLRLNNNLTNTETPCPVNNSILPDTIPDELFEL